MLSQDVNKCKHFYSNCSACCDALLSHDHEDTHDWLVPLWLTGVCGGGGGMPLPLTRLSLLYWLQVMDGCGIIGITLGGVLSWWVWSLWERLHPHLQDTNGHWMVWWGSQRCQPHAMTRSQREDSWSDVLDSSPATDWKKESTLAQVESIARCIEGSKKDTRTAFRAKQKTKFNDYGKGNMLNYATGFQTIK